MASPLSFVSPAGTPRQLHDTSLCRAIQPCDQVRARLRKERSIEQDFPRIPRTPPKFCHTGRSRVRGRDVQPTLGGGGALFLFADFFPGEGAMEHAARAAGFAVLLWDPRAKEREDLCRESVLRLVKYAPDATTGALGEEERR